MGLNGRWEWLRLVTPAGVAIGIFMMGILLNSVDKLDNKVFLHLTNDDIHIPRGYIVSKEEYQIYTNLTDKIFGTLCNKVERLEYKIDKLILKEKG